MFIQVTHRKTRRTARFSICAANCTTRRTTRISSTLGWTTSWRSWTFTHIVSRIRSATESKCQNDHEGKKIFQHWTFFSGFWIKQNDAHSSWIKRMSFQYMNMISLFGILLPINSFLDEEKKKGQFWRLSIVDVLFVHCRGSIPISTNFVLESSLRHQRPLELRCFILNRLQLSSTTTICISTV